MNKKRKQRRASAYYRVLEDVERELLARALAKAKGNIHQAAIALELPLSTMKYKVTTLLR